MRPVYRSLYTDRRSEYPLLTRVHPAAGQAAVDPTDCRASFSRFLIRPKNVSGGRDNRFMQEAANQLAQFDRISDRIVSLSADKARIEAEIAGATEELRRLFEDRAMQGSGGTSRRTNIADTTTASELACLLRITERSAHRLVQHSALLVNHHPNTLEALRSGSISWAHATTLLHEYAGLPPGTAVNIEKTLLPVAEVTTVPRLSYRARTLRTTLHPVTLDERARTARSRRRVDFEPADDAMAWLHIHLPATDAAGIDTRLTDAARALQGPGDPRTLQQLRTDVVMDLLLIGTRPTGCNHGLPHGGSAENTSTPEWVDCPRASAAPRVRAHINVTVPVLTLLGVDDAYADIEGYGPIPADVARRLAAHAPSFTRLLTHPESGAVLSVGRTTYAVPADLKKWLRVRDRTCRHPGCAVPAARCELDHTRPWSQQGTTAHNNLAHLCRKHHMLKSEGIWHYRQPSPGVLTAISPAGRTYRSTVDPLLA